MKTRLRNILLTLLCFAILTVPAMAGKFPCNVPLPTDASALHERQMKELRVFAGLDVSLNVVDSLDIPAREHAQALWDDAGTALWGNGAEVGSASVVIVYDAAHNSAGIALSEGARAFLTNADVDAVEASFTSPDSDDPYVHVLNGLKRLEICSLDGADIPACSYAAQYLRDPDSVPDPVPGPDSRIDILTGERDDARGAEGDGYDRAMAGLNELAKILFADGSRAYDPNSGIALALDPNAFEESTAFPVPAVAANAAAVVVIAAVTAIVLIRRKKSRA